MTLKLNGSSSGYTAIDAPAAAGSNTLVLPADNGSNGEFLQTNGSGTLDWAAVTAGFTTAVDDASVGTGTTYQATGIGADAKYVVMTWDELSSAVASTIYIKFGTSGSISTGNYFNTTTWIGGGTTSQDSYADKIAIRNTDADAAYKYSGVMECWRHGTSNTWLYNINNTSESYTGSDSRIHRTFGRWRGTGVLTRILIEFTGQSFDDGEISLNYI